jgi:hypothetical protein
MPNTVRLHRVLATKSDKIYRAFLGIVARMSKAICGVDGGGTQT